MVQPFLFRRHPATYHAVAGGVRQDRLPDRAPRWFMLLQELVYEKNRIPVAVNRQKKKSTLRLGGKAPGGQSAQRGNRRLWW